MLIFGILFDTPRSLLTDLFRALKVWHARSLDRKYVWPLTQKGGGVNTKCRTQEQLNLLYTGPSINIEKEYALLASKLFIILLFSIGMPFLYPVLLTFLSLKLFLDRFLCIYFYRTFENKVKDELAKLVLNWSFVAIFFHFLIGVFMIADPEIQRSYDEVDKSSIEA